MCGGPSGGAQRPGSPGGAAPDRWQQQAGFSVFFDVQPGGPQGRTRLYHEETGDEMAFPGCEPADWVTWMLDRLGPAQPEPGAVGASASVVTIEIIDARLTAGTVPGGGGDSVGIELQLRVSGMAELRRALGARVAGVLFGPQPR